MFGSDSGHRHVHDFFRTQLSAPKKENDALVKPVHIALSVTQRKAKNGETPKSKKESSFSKGEKSSKYGKGND